MVKMISSFVVWLWAGLNTWSVARTGCLLQLGNSMNMSLLTLTRTLGCCVS